MLQYQQDEEWRLSYHQGGLDPLGGVAIPNSRQIDHITMSPKY